MKRDENFFCEKSSEGVLKPIVEQKNHAMRSELLRLQKLRVSKPPPLQEEEYITNALKIVTKKFRGAKPIVLQLPMLREEKPSV